MESRRRSRLLSLLRTRAPQPVQQWGTKHTDGIWEASTGSAWANTRTMAEVPVGRCWCQTTHPSPVVKCGTFSHLLQVLEDAEVVCQVCGQDDVPHEVQHALVVLEGQGRASRSLPHTPHPLQGRPAPSAQPSRPHTTPSPSGRSGQRCCSHGC